MSAFDKFSNLRRRKNYQLVCPDTYDIKNVPFCPHGPCLLFKYPYGRSSKDGSLKYEMAFVCSVHRSSRCPYKWIVKNGRLESKCKFFNNHSELRIETRLSRKFIYGKIRRSVNKLLKDRMELHYCKECNDAVPVPHIHATVGPWRVKHFRKPTNLLKPLTNDECEAQYWFDENSLKLIVKTVLNNGFDGILCIAAPTVFESFQETSHLRSTFKSFLLDFDSRFEPFYPPSSFAQFNLLSNYVYDSSVGARKLKQFLDSVKYLIVICDPPFGIYIEAMMKTIESLRNLILMGSSQEKVMNVMLILPIFVGKHAQRYDKNLQMVDYKVCYKNHPAYRNPRKSIVRIFTDIPVIKFVLPIDEGYRFCDGCKRYVATEMEHCSFCNICASNLGAKSKHCTLCSRCVKYSYIHCDSCRKCHLPGRCIWD